MTPPDQERARSVRAWVAKAEEDLRAGALLHKGPAGEGVTALHGAVAFHAQQAAEKYLNAILVHWEVPFPKTHDIAPLVRLVATVDQEMASGLVDCVQSNSFAVDYRYPGDLPQLTRDEAEDALGLAGVVRDAVREALGSAIGEIAPENR